MPINKVNSIRTNWYEITEALLKVKQRWLDIRDGRLAEKEGGCDLCKVTDKYNVVDSLCVGCVVRYYTGLDLCEGTPYIDWMYYWRYKKLSMLDGALPYSSLQYVVDDDYSYELANNICEYINDLILYWFKQTKYIYMEDGGFIYIPIHSPSVQFKIKDGPFLFPIEENKLVASSKGSTYDSLMELRKYLGLTNNEDCE